MPQNIHEFLANNIYNIRGWRTKRRIIIFESDDWGSIRMPDKVAYNALLSRGIRVDNCPFNRYDCLESEDDLAFLFEILCNFRDLHGNTPVITANCVIANPDFEKIRKANFHKYYYELVTETFKKYPKHSSSFSLWREGIERKLFLPQFHGREHLNVARWMNALKLNLPETRLAFDLNLFGISTTISTEDRKSYLEAFAIDKMGDEDQIRNILTDGLQLFRNILGFSSKSFIAPNYVWPSQIEQDLFKQNIKYIQGQRVQWSPEVTSIKYKKISHFIGQSNTYGQIYTIRNCQFEPSIYRNKDEVDKCLAQIKNAFRWGKPAIITSHRVNYIGSLDPVNRDSTLHQVKVLLTQIQNNWPDVEYMTSDKLGDLISTETHNSDDQ